MLDSFIKSEVFQMQKTKLQGFTLIELVVVIIILGILAVAAAPKFINLKSDAMSANLNGLEGALTSANSLVYSKAILTGQENLDPGSITVNGSTISTTVGYITPTAANIGLAIEGTFEKMVSSNDDITADWGIYEVPANGVGGTGGVTVTIYPKGYNDSSSPAGTACYLLYNITSAPGLDPAFYEVTSTGC